MDDSEKSYGYSEDIYHGTHNRDAEKSYEYGAETSGDSERTDLAPEERALHIEGSNAQGATGDEDEAVAAAREAGEYDYDRGGEYAAVESFTWSQGEGGEEKPDRER